jgi:hypothetical protein
MIILVVYEDWSTVVSDRPAALEPLAGIAEITALGSI